ncbi:putative L-lactate dehydrogenase [Actinacidiphila reveromycinica]|uniref:Putative L-lactate dehydrogenase n=1 Tax=Actinacidiphila reveromycinica TaxID=659352 RepID=A0A7U3VRL2_9ACTN|nr:alpha-hydroxy acid oxidase [Streptomyces sp. SN-593]BBB00963.1 putative L-lactate dehydrogenase [Streptomyces sp. SN-593]
MTVFKYQLTAGREPINIDDYRRQARRSLPDMVWSFFDYGAEDNVTLAHNREAFARYALRQRVLVGNEPVDLGTTVAGDRLDLPVLLAPTGLSGLVHWSGERAACVAAEKAGTLAVLSTASSYSYEEVAEATERDHFFQLYPYHDSSSSTGSMQNNVVASLMDRAQEAGFRAMFVTADVPMSGNKEAERRRGLGKPPVMTPRRAMSGALHPRWAYGFVRHQRISMRNLVDTGGSRAAMSSLVKQERMMRRELSWDDLAWMRKRWDGPLYVKGVLDPQDAARAVDVGADGLVVSNHGGRQLDGAPASLDALPAIVERVGTGAEVLFDGGIRRGTDVIKALALGARAVLIGRPYLYGLAVDGENGVRRVLEILGEEMSRAMTLMGVKSLADLDPSCVFPVGAPVVDQDR